MVCDYYYDKCVKNAIYQINNCYQIMDTANGIRWWSFFQLVKFLVQIMQQIWLAKALSWWVTHITKYWWYLANTNVVKSSLFFKANSRQIYQNESESLWHFLNILHNLHNYIKSTQFEIILNNVFYSYFLATVYLCLLP